MERLTEKNESGCAMAACCGEACEYNYVCEVGGFGECKGMDDIIDRLAAYEDTGLEPQEITRIVDEYGHGHTLRTHAAERLELIREIPTDRLRELVEAERDGRAAILPCKNWLENVFGEQETFYGIDPDYEEDQIREITVCNEERFTWYDGWETVLLKGHDENGLDWEFSPEDIGKTVFLAREAAEAALKGEHHG